MSEAISEQSNVVPLPGLRRGRGRPPGSRNKTSKSAKELLDKHGKGAIETLCAIAAGHVVYSPPDDDGKRVKLSPTLTERLMAAKIIADKLLPNLKFAEVSAELDSHVRTDGDVEPSTRDLGKAILSILGKGVPEGGRVTVEEPGVHVARFSNPDLGRTIFPDSKSPASAVTDAGTSPIMSVTADESTTVPGPATKPAVVGDSVLCAAGQCRVILSMQSGIAKWGAYREATRELLRFVDSEAAGVAWAEQRLREKGFV